MINTILIDGDVQSRQRLAELLAAHTDFCIVASCATIEAALGALERGPVDMALLDVDLPDCDAKHFIQEFRQRCGEPLIFLTAPDASYAVHALDVGADYVLLKPYTAAAVNGIVERARLLSLRLRKRVSIRTFGTFEVFSDGKPLAFKRSIAKELLAVLTDRRGSGMTSRQICALIRPDNSDEEKNMNYIRQGFSDLRKALESVGAGDILLRSGIHSYCVDTELMDCDYYSFLECGKPPFNGEYMKQYSWAEDTCALLSERID